MTQVQQAPITDPMIEFGEQKIPNDSAFGKARLSWILYFQNLLAGDRGTGFVPTYANLTVVGTPTVQGSYYVNNGFADFFIVVTPGTNTSATAGSTYFQLPFDVRTDGPCFVVLGLSTGMGAVEAATNRVYPPTWNVVTSPLTLYGRVKV